MKSRENIEVEKNYGYIHIEGVADKPHKAYNCQCLKCKKYFIATGSIIHKYASTGCSKCRQFSRNEEKASQYIHKVFGELEVLDYVGIKQICKNGKTASYMNCRCLKCGETTEVPLSRLLSGKAYQCVSCSRKNLDLGHRITKEATCNGTSVICISENRKINNNNKTGITGVSWIPSLQKYRAYINFQRKQYHLGVYEELDSAIKARKTAEEEIYGNFLEWYKNTYPEKWEHIKNSQKN